VRRTLSSPGRRKSPALGRSWRVYPRPGYPATGRLSRWCIPLRWRRVTQGYIWLLDPDEQVPLEALDGLSELIDQAASVLAVRSRDAERVGWATVELLSADAGARGRAVDDLRGLGLLPATGGVRVIALAPRDHTEVGPVNTWMLPRSVLAAPYGQRATAIIPSTADARNIAAKIAQGVAGDHPAGLVAGISSGVEPTEAHQGWRQAVAALEVALRRPLVGDRELNVAEWETLGVERLLSVADSSALVAALTDARVERLAALDAETRATLRVYLDNAGSVQQASRALSIHRQTLYQRLQRISEYTGLELSDGQDRLLAHLVLTLASPDSVGPMA